MRFFAVLIALGVIWFSFAQPPRKTEAAAPPVPTAPPATVHYSDEWTERKYNPSSDALGAYQDAVEDLNLRVGLANALALCGLRNGDWYRSETHHLATQRPEPEIQALWNALTEDERRQARRYDATVVRGKEEFHLGPNRNDCSGLQKWDRGDF